MDVQVMSSRSTSPGAEAVILTPSTPLATVVLNLEYDEVRWKPSVSRRHKPAIDDQFSAYRTHLSSLGDGDGPSPDFEAPFALAAGFLSYLSRNEDAGLLTRNVLNAFENDFLTDTDIHTLSSTLSPQSQRVLLSDYFETIQTIGSIGRSPHSTLFSRAKRGDETLFAICGGQGPSNATCLKELRDVHTVYGGILDELLSTASEVLDRLANLDDTVDYFLESGFDVRQWITSPETAPEDRISQAPYSFPLIGLLSLAHYCVTCKVLGQTPSEVAGAFKGATGHSQGIIPAAMISRSGDWPSFYDSVRIAMEMLFWIGFECHHTASFAPVALQDAKDCADAGEGIPSPMLSVRGLDREPLQAVLDKMNRQLSAGDQLSIALLNSRDSMVVAGSPLTLCALSARLRKLKASSGQDQSKIIFNQRKPVIQHQFLPMSSPFHSPLSAAATPTILRRLQAVSVRGNDLTTSVFHTCSGEDLREYGDSNVVPCLIEMITSDLVDWPRVTSFKERSTVVDFGPGKLGLIVQKANDGKGIRAISACHLAPSKGLGSKSELFSSAALRQIPCWGELFQPRVKTSPASASATFETKMTKRFGTPPVMVGGMTPTSVPWDFVAAITNAGYHAELACGGYNSASSLEAAIISLSKAIPATAGITCNIIYASPKVIAWQIPLLRDLIRKGYPIHGLTIGAGIPSEEVVKEYIETMSLKHISFKPGSTESIKQVIKIARTYPDFSIGLQWTGGRAGGHHSYEDFHSPLIEMYSEIRQCDNIVLIAGSGFGGAQDSYPYITGEWSTGLGLARMPFDGVLLGSRMMVAKEAHTSVQAKGLIIEASGVSDSDWHASYSKPTGGILTVKSEMGQPIHKLATRGVMLWHELDEKIFSVRDPAKRLEGLNKNRSWIISRLNTDFQKPWFAIDAEGRVVEIEDMTYIEVLDRLLELMYVQHQQRWIDESYRLSFEDFISRTRERLACVTPMAVTSSENPRLLLASLIKSFPGVEDELLHPEDASYFISLCKQRGRKPVNFVPRLDESFETWFKKDSLWQAEDVDALPDQDVQRACIIHGPVAAKFSTIVDEPVKSILDSIQKGYIEKLQQVHSRDLSDGAHGATTRSGDLDNSLDSLIIEDTILRKCYRFPKSGILPDTASFRDRLCRDLSGWALDCLEEEFIRHENLHRTNPVRSALVPTNGHDLSIEYEKDGLVSALVMSRQESTQSQPRESLRVTADEDGKEVTAILTAPTGSTCEEAELHFKFQYRPQLTLIKFEEDTVGRNQRIKDFYSRLWLPDSECMEKADLHTRFPGVQTTLTADLVQEFYRGIGFTGVVNDSQIVPLDICIVVVWEALVKPLLAPVIDCDLLQLLHRSNEFRYIGAAKPLRIGDSLESASRIQSVAIHNGNKLVEVLVEIKRDGTPVVEVLSKFFVKGSYTDVEDTFSSVHEPHYEVPVRSEIDGALLTSRKWLHFSRKIVPGQNLIFEITTESSYDATSKTNSLSVFGDVYTTTEEDRESVGRVQFEGSDCLGNPVLEFLGRHGTDLSKPVQLQNPGLNSESTCNINALRSSKVYAKVSKDSNPIHTSPVFAHYAQLPGVVNHGMGTSAIVLRAIERTVADGDPSRIRRYTASFEAMVLSNDELRVEVQHTGMKGGQMSLNIQAFNEESGEKVLEAEADIEQPPTAYIFTGQGSQEKGMGMKLYESSEAARALWDKADRSLYELYGFSILDIVRNEPKTITVHFGGAKGRKLRDNYLSLTIDRAREDGKVVQEPILKGLTPTSRSYTFSDPRGLLYSTQFAQPAITLMEMATIADLESKGLMQQKATYAGHSLGEYSALGAIAKVIPMDSMVSLVFYRGLAMQVAMERDADGRTEFSMMAANPSRVAKVFDQKALEAIVKMIAGETGVLLEIVNFNVYGRQYVCAGHLRALWTMTQVLDILAKSKISQVPDEAELLRLVQEQAEASLDVAEPIELERGVATIPLKGIDVPFHSRYLRDGIPAYRRYLETQILENNIDVDKLDGFIPNVTAKPFSTNKEYVEEAAAIMDSEELRVLLKNVSDYPGLP